MVAPKESKQLSSLLVVAGIDSDWRIGYALVNAQQIQGDERSCMIKRCIKSGFNHGTLGISKREPLIGC